MDSVGHFHIGVHRVPFINHIFSRPCHVDTYRDLVLLSESLRSVNSATSCFGVGLLTATYLPQVS